MTRARDLAAFVSNADGDVKFDTDTLFIDSSANRVGIGLTNPTGSLHISNSAPSFYMTDTTNNTEGVVSMDNAGSLILNADLNNEASSSNIRFAVDGTERMRINQSGNVHITDNTNGPDSALHIEKTTPQIRLQLNGNSGYNTIESGGSNELIIGRSGTEQLRVLSGGGLTFNGDTAADNALNDYERGLHTISINQGGIGFNTLYQNFQYIKIGDMVTIFGLLLISSSGDSNALKINMPFTAKSGLAQTADGTHGVAATYQVDTGSIGLSCRVGKGTDKLTFQKMNDNAAWTNLAGNELSNGDHIYVNITYEAA